MSPARAARAHAENGPVSSRSDISAPRFYYVFVQVGDLNGQTISIAYRIGVL
jgi:hypothetical protein